MKWTKSHLSMETWTPEVRPQAEGGCVPGNTDGVTKCSVQDHGTDEDQQGPATLQKTNLGHPLRNTIAHARRAPVYLFSAYKMEI